MNEIAVWSEELIGWVFWDETGMHCSQAYLTKEDAVKAAVAYAKTLVDDDDSFHAA